MTKSTRVPVMVAPFRLDDLERRATAPDGRGRHAATARLKGKGRHHRGRIVAVLVLAVLLAAGAFFGSRLAAAAPAAKVTSVLAPTVTLASPAVNLPWPVTGEAAVAVPSLGIDQASGPEQPVPVASLTKMMTGYVIFRDHPLAPGQNGPNITITQDDLSDFNADTVSDQANAQVTLGEVLTERQLLGGMLVHSANDYADALARWDAGSVAAFVVKMNQTAVQLGMTHTHYADASGFLPASQSTASDLLKVAAPDMNNPVFASMVQMKSITLPVAGTVSTYTPLLGLQGVLGVKSGFTNAAGGCDVLAVVRKVHGLPVLILTAVTGQTGPNVLVLAGLVALNLANNVSTSIGVAPVVQKGTVVARVSAAGHTVAAVAQSSGNVLSWPGAHVTQILESTRPVAAGARRGARVGSMVVELGGQRLVIPVGLQADLPEETLLQRLF